LGLKMFKKIKRFFANRKLQNIIDEIEYAQASLEFYKGKLYALNEAKHKAEFDLDKFYPPVDAFFHDYYPRFESSPDGRSEE